MKNELHNFFVNPSWSFWRFEGRDTTDFIKRITTLDPSRIPFSESEPLAAGESFPSQLGFILNHLGRIESSFWITRGPSSVFWITFSENSETLWAPWDRYHFSEDLKKTLLETGMIVDTKQGETEIQMRLRRGLSSNQNSSSEDESDCWDCFRCDSFLGESGHEFVPTLIPHEVHGLGGIHESKGCYPGQEVIERTSTRGEPPKRLVRLENKAGLDVSTLTQRGFTVTTYCPKHHRALAVISKVLLKNVLADSGFRNQWLGDTILEHEPRQKILFL